MQLMVKINKNSIKFKLFTYFIILITLIELVIGIVTFSISKNLVNDKINRYEKTIMKQIIKNIEFQTGQIKSVAVNIMINNDVQRVLRDYKYLENDSDELSDHLLITKFLRNNMFAELYIDSIYIDSFRENDYYVGNLESYQAEEISEYYKHHPLKNEQWIYYGEDDGVSIANYNVISYATYLKDFYKGLEKTGILHINVKTRMFDKTFDVDYLKKDVCYLIVSDDNVIYSYNPQGLKYDAQDILDTNKHNTDNRNYYIKKIEDENYVFSFEDIAASDWNLVSITPEQVYIKDVNKIKFITIITGIVSLFIAIYLSLKFYATLFAPLNDLIKNMKRVEKGDLSVRLDNISKDEIGYIQRVFNNMIGRIKKLIHDTYEKEQLKRNAELIALQAQINPHFLYNTLNSINCIAKLKNEEDISKIVVSLSDLLRISISNRNEYITLREEISYVSKYLLIQNIRYNNKFSLECNIDERYLDKLTLKLILQPLVENCIYHGMANISGQGVIEIRCFETDGEYCIELSDNGVGMSDAQIEAMNESLAKARCENAEKIGVNNVNARIKLHFGEQYGLRFEKRDDASGIKVIIKVPLMDMD